ncbi:hypothetical protein [Amycolatopsis sp. TNS106]|uniref:hypothetical protein n=1 Tax=Amycolatopsis sp. TNS106 TaxID=2861750 RepID=UPI001C5872F2|nr:hypothetical protein [Amycolatopsis sp. TNS106]QXV60373.1 hypothetical protein CVV72_27485 [Amycolatopsis sp. TNS106]
MIRGALWLVQVVGLGNTFTKEQVRTAFPGISQADRRLRDLRKYGWVILTNIEDATLGAEDQRFAQVGVSVWDPEARRAADLLAGPTAKEVQAVMARDGYLCTVCGISAAEPYADDTNQTAVLSVTRHQTVMPDGTRGFELITECKRCRAGAASGSVSVNEVLSEIQALEPDDRDRLARWVKRGRRGATPLDRAWNSYRRLAESGRDTVRSSLEL